MNIEFHSEYNQLTFDTVYTVLRKLYDWLEGQKASNLIINFSNIEFIDSAGVAMLVELRRLSIIKYHKNLAFKFSSQMKQMMRFYELEDFLESIE